MVFFHSDSPRPVAESRIACVQPRIPATSRDRSMDPPVSGTYKEPPRQCHMLWDEQWILRPGVTNFSTALVVGVVPLAPALDTKACRGWALSDLVWRWI